MVTYLHYILSVNKSLHQKTGLAPHHSDNLVDLYQI